MNSNLIKIFQGMAIALLLVLLAGCSSTTTGEGASNTRPPGTITIRENEVLRIGIGNVGEGTLVFRGWQYTFQVENMILHGVGPGAVELKGDVWNLETVEDFAGTYHSVEADITEGRGVSNVWIENEKGVKVNIRTEGQDLTMRLDPVGSVVTLK